MGCFLPLKDTFVTQTIASSRRLCVPRRTLFVIDPVLYVDDEHYLPYPPSKVDDEDYSDSNEDDKEFGTEEHLQSMRHQKHLDVPKKPTTNYLNVRRSPDDFYDDIAGKFVFGFLFNYWDNEELGTSALHCVDPLMDDLEAEGISIFSHSTCIFVIVSNQPTT